MSGRLVGLVVEHGPEDHHEWSVAVVIAEDMHNPGDTALLSLEELATRSRLGRATVARAVKRMVAAGRMTYTPGSGRGYANRYRLLFGGVVDNPERVSTGDPLDDQKGSPTDTLSGRKGSPTGRKGSPVETPHRHRKSTTTTNRSVTDGHQGDRVVADGGGGGADPSDSENGPTTPTTPTWATEPPLPVSLPGGRPDPASDPELVDLKRCLIRDLGEHWPRGWEAVQLVQRALDVDGWDWGFLTGMLTDEATNPTTKNAPGLIRDILRKRPLPTPQQRADYDWSQPAASRWCSECVDGWVKDHNGERSETLCGCRSGARSADMATIAATTTKPFTIPGGAAARSYA